MALNFYLDSPGNLHLTYHLATSLASSATIPNGQAMVQMMQHSPKAAIRSKVFNHPKIRRTNRMVSLQTLAWNMQMVEYEERIPDAVFRLRLLNHLQRYGL